MIRSLFLKIFLWFLCALALVGIASILAVPRGEPPFEARWRESTGAVLAIAAPEVAEAIEREGTAGLPARLERLEARARVRSFVFAESGEEVLGRQGPPGAREVASSALAGDDVAFSSGPGRPQLAARAAAASSGRRYALVFVAPGPPPDPPPHNMLPHPLPLRLALIFGIAAVGCWGLARYLTAPVARLRAATRRLSGGDLSVRVAGDLGRRRDELVELAQDFDVMAGRIEALVGAERRLLGDVSHELRSPLTRLRVALELARQRAGSDAEGALDRIEREAERLDDLIGQILTLTRLEAGGAVPRERIDLAALVSDVAADADFEARGRGVTVRVVASEACAIDGDARLLRSAVENVVRNAVGYTGEGTEVEVRLSRDGGDAVVRVRDHGPGVPESALSELFKPFFRVAEARDRQTGGTGLGLAITDRAARFHGGSATATNAPGGGLAVEIRLPASSNHSRTGTAPLA